MDTQKEMKADKTRQDKTNKHITRIVSMATINIILVAMSQ